VFGKLFGFKKSTDALEEDLPADANWGFIGTDMHSHLIPGIDDGSKSTEDSISLIRSLIGLGYTSIITTPHVMIDFYPNTAKIILDGLAGLQTSLAEQDISIKIKAAAEYYIDESFVELLEREPLLCVHKNQVLVEFSMLYEPPMLFDVIFKMITNGYVPILAHPERYVFLHNHPEKFQSLKDRGCLFQLNQLSITGYYGQNIRKVALKLMHERMYDYIGSDMHHEKHAEGLTKMLTIKEHYFPLYRYPFKNSQLSLW